MKRSLPVFDLRLLGLAALVFAPSMFVETLRHPRGSAEDGLSHLLYGLFSFGWLCALLGLRQLRAAGDGRFGRALLTLAPITAILAIGQSFMDAFGVPSTNPFYLLTDLAWPFTMLLTFVISVVALFARRLPVWGRAVMVYASFSLPATILLGVLKVQLPFDTFGPHTATGWALWGLMLIVLGRRPAVAPAPIAA